MADKAKRAEASIISAASAEGLMLLLRAQMDAYKDMITLSEAMRESITRCDTDGVTDTLSKQRDQLLRIQNMEARREALTERIAGAIGAQAGELTLSSIAEHTEDGARERLNVLSKALNEVVARQRELNEQNAALLEMSLDITQAIVTAMTDNQHISNTYSLKGLRGGAERPQTNLFVRDV